jgi:glycosyltransferase involved in cell wall biosynthesis
MRILYLSQYFFPEVGATQIRAYEMAYHWVQMGHQVTMLCEFPNHPSGIIPAEYRGKLLQRDQLDGIDIYRVWVKASQEKNFRNRMIFYFSFMASATLAGLFLTRGKYNFIYASSPPLFVGGAALALSFFKRIPLVFEVRDLWPESAVALGELSNPTAIALATRLEESCYQHARKVIVVTQGFRERLLSRGYPDDKIALIPNGASPDLFQFDSAAREKIRAELGLQGKFIAIYAGIHGIAQDLYTVVEAARILRGDPDIHFLFVGEGPQKAEIAARMESYHLPNLTMLPEQPRQIIPAFLSAADVALIPLRKIELFKGVIPAKLFDAWSCSLPVLLGVDGEARELMEEAKAGVFIPPEDTQALVSALQQMKNDPATRAQMGENGREFTVQKYSRQAQAEKLAKLLESMFS